MPEEIDYLSEIKKMKLNLSSSMVYYLTEKILDNPILENTQIDIDRKFLNQVIYCNKDSEVFPEIPQMAYFEILNKQTLLEANTFRLLQLKSKLDVETFSLIKSKYFDEISNYYNLSSILNEFYEEACFVKSNDLKNCLSLQERIFLEHFNEIKIKFIDLRLPKLKPNIFVKNLLNSEKQKLKSLILKGNPEKVERILVDNFKDSNNKTLNRLFTALDNLGYIKIEHGERNKIIEYFNNSIGENKFSPTSVFKTKIDIYTDVHYKKIRNKLVDLIGGNT